jgi:hypothetical protein
VRLAGQKVVVVVKLGRPATAMDGGWREGKGARQVGAKRAATWSAVAWSAVAAAVVVAAAAVAAAVAAHNPLVSSQQQERHDLGGGAYRGSRDLQGAVGLALKGRAGTHTAPRCKRQVGRACLKSERCSTTSSIVL